MNPEIHKIYEAIGEFMTSTGRKPSVILLSHDFYYSDDFKSLLFTSLLVKNNHEGLSEFKLNGCKTRIVSPLITDCKEIEVY